jgi:hypothetical protein
MALVPPRCRPSSGTGICFNATPLANRTDPATGFARVNSLCHPSRARGADRAAGAALRLPPDVGNFFFADSFLATFWRKIAGGAAAGGIAMFAENCKVGRICN